MKAIEMLEIVAAAIADLPMDVTFTGGATIPLYLDAIAALEVRPTDDVDCVVEVTTQVGYYQLAAQLRSLGLEEDATPGAPLCRWLCQGIKLDMMPIDERVLGFGNQWYLPGVAAAIDYRLPSGRQIRIFSLPYVIAAKIVAFQSRGKSQHYFSKDFEDLVALFNGAPNFLAEIATTETEVRAYIIEWIRAEQKNLNTIAPSFLSNAEQIAGRGRLLIERISAVANLQS
jgi:hypothetical protein